MDKVDVIVIGGGAVGLAVARQLALSGKEVIVCEKEARIAEHCSSRNSEVVHAGMYYEGSSSKAFHCVKGMKLLREYCHNRHIEYSPLGKLIVATNDHEVEKLHSIYSQGLENDVESLQLYSSSMVGKMQSEISCHEAIFSPDTAIFDSHSFILSLVADLESKNGMVVTGTEVTKIRKNGEVFEVTVSIHGQENYSFQSVAVVNCASLWAPSIAKKIDGIVLESIPESIFVQGRYCSYSGRHPFNNLVYPVPVDGGLGVHLTLDLTGSARFGPDTNSIDSISYDMNAFDTGDFYNAIKRYWPKVVKEKLVPDYCGIRPKISFNGKVFTDFLIQSEAQHGMSGLVNLYGIESPGLTSSLSIGLAVAEIL